MVARDGEFRGSKEGSERDMKAAWDFARLGKYEEAKSIINAYAEKLQRLDGHDAPLCIHLILTVISIQRKTTLKLAATRDVL